MIPILFHAIVLNLTSGDEEEQLIRKMIGPVSCSALKLDSLDMCDSNS